jgi:hypothetical protein
MRLFKFELECDNAAFGDNSIEARFEIARILSELASKIRKDSESLYPNSAQWIRDVNGNRVGTYKFESR